jgi:threonine/homoserine/homoserine lactone efflux protein
MKNIDKEIIGLVLLGLAALILLALAFYGLLQYFGGSKYLMYLLPAMLGASFAKKRISK